MFNLINSKLTIIFVLVWGLCSCTHTHFYIVRHAEKSSSPTSDPELTLEGKKRAEKLKEILKTKDIQQIYSTKTVRTLNTAKPLADLNNIEVKIYDAKNQSQFIEELKFSNRNSLIVGHSNTIRYVVNGLSEKEVLSKDLEDSEYNFLFHIKKNKKGKPKIAINHF